MARKVVKYCYQYSMSWYEGSDKWSLEQTNKIWVEDKKTIKSRVLSSMEYTCDFTDIQVRRCKEFDMMENIPITESLKIDDKEKALMAHTYGMDTRDPENFGYRNYFYTHNDVKITGLVEKGFMLKGHEGSGGGFYYHLSDLGIKTLLSMYPVFRKDIDQGLAVPITSKPCQEKF